MTLQHLAAFFPRLRRACSVTMLLVAAAGVAGCSHNRSSYRPIFMRPCLGHGSLHDLRRVPRDRHDRGTRRRPDNHRSRRWSAHPSTPTSPHRAPPIQGSSGNRRPPRRPSRLPARRSGRSRNLTRSRLAPTQRNSTKPPAGTSSAKPGADADPPGPECGQFLDDQAAWTAGRPADHGGRVARRSPHPAGRSPPTVRRRDERPGALLSQQGRPSLALYRPPSQRIGQRQLRPDRPRTPQDPGI